MDEFAAFLSGQSLRAIMDAIDEQEEYGLRGTYEALVAEREHRFRLIEAS